SLRPCFPASAAIWSRIATILWRAGSSFGTCHRESATCLPSVQSVPRPSMSGGCERRGGLGSLIASSNYTKKRAPRNGCRESRAPLACGLHGATLGATLDPRAPACVQPVDQRVGGLDRGGGRHLDRAPILPD